VELREPLRIAHEPGRQELQRDGLPEPQIVGAVDLPHAAAAEEPEDEVAVVEDRAWRKTPVIDGARPSLRDPQAGQKRLPSGTDS
jgi:hypothetical protein